jgi:hypothetical protein
MKNWNCDGAHCAKPNSETRVYPLGGGANLILCEHCFTHENAYRVHRATVTRRPQSDWPVINWATARQYPEPQEN